MGGIVSIIEEIVSAVAKPYTETKKAEMVRDVRIAAINAKHAEHMQALKVLEAAFSNPAITPEMFKFLTQAYAAVTLSCSNNSRICLGYNEYEY